MTIQTERLALRPMRQEDLAGLQEMLFDERVMYAYEHRFTPEDAQAWLLRQQRRYREDGFGLWAMVERQSGEMVGQAGITWQDCEGELAWLYVDPSRAHRGIGQALCRYALQAFPGIHTVEVLKGNEPARKLYESLGFSAGQTLRGRMPGNEQFAVEVYQLTK